MRKFLISLLTVLIVLSATPFAFADNQVKIFVNNQELKSDVPPQVINDRVMVPVRFIAEALGISPENILWDDRNKFVTLVRPNKVVGLGVYYYWILVNGNTIEITDRTPPIMINDRVYIPLRLVAEVFGCDVNWNNDTQTVNIKQSSINNDSEKLSPLIYNWTFENKFYTITLKDINNHKNLYKPENALAILHQYKLKAHPLLQQRYPDLQGPVFQWMEKTIKNYTEDKDNKEIISALALTLKDIASKNGISEDKKLAQFVISFCQYVPYKKDSPPFQFLIEFDEYPKYPIETLLENAGDCEDKAMLSAVLLRELGYETALVLFPGHMAIGVGLTETISPDDNYYLFDNIKYLYTEISNNDWPIGVIPNELKNKPHLLFPL